MKAQRDLGDRGPVKETTKYGNCDALQLEAAPHRVGRYSL